PFLYFCRSRPILVRHSSEQCVLANQPWRAALQARRPRPPERHAPKTILADTYKALREGLPSLAILEHDFCPKVSPNSESIPSRVQGRREENDLCSPDRSIVSRPLCRRLWYQESPRQPGSFHRL